jgi:hypothetical protein
MSWLTLDRPYDADTSSNDEEASFERPRIELTWHEFATLTFYTRIRT